MSSRSFGTTWITWSDLIFLSEDGKPPKYKWKIQKSVWNIHKFCNWVKQLKNTWMSLTEEHSSGHLYDKSYDDLMGCWRPSFCVL